MGLGERARQGTVSAPQSGWLVLLVAFSACTTSRVAQPGTPQTGAFLRAVSGDVVTVHLADGESARARAVRIDADSTSWLDPASRSVRRVATADVVSLERTDRTRGAIRGGVTAAAVVGVASAVAFYALQDPADCTPTIVTGCGTGTRVALSVAAGAAGGFLAAFPGAGVGALVGETDRLTLAPPQRAAEAGWAPGPPLAR